MQSSFSWNRLARLGAAVVVLTHSLSLFAGNVILFIGDGMGFEHVRAAALYNGAPLSFEALPYQGQVTTYSANNAVTDSAAAGTAMATGRKVNNYVVSQANPGDGSDVPTSLEYYKGMGRKVGLITTTYLTHATPATFGAHAADRNYTSEIGQDYLQGSRPNILFGGGGNGLTVSGTAAAGYQVATDAAGLASLDLNATSTHISAQFGSTFLPYEYDYLAGTYPNPHLSDMVAKALAELQDQPEGFFLVVEGGMIDQACHSNQLERSIHETLELSRAVSVALNWASGRSDTLILVTADHETGGLKITRDNGPGNYPTVTWSTTGHTAANVPVYAQGPGADRVTGVLDNTDMFWITTGQFKPEALTLIPQGATWKYEASGADLGTAWRAPAYNDAAWFSGAAQLGYGDGDETTLLPASPVRSCYYFRHHFTIDNPSAYSSLSLRLLRDDGAVVYLNGTEVARYNMPTGTINYSTWASGAAEYGWDAAVEIQNLLVAGDNVIAVEVHQGNSTSSDLSLDLELTAVRTAADETAPVISNVAATANDKAAAITWTTDENADSRVFYQAAGASAWTELHDATLTKTHQVVVSGLLPSTPYDYYVSSTDASGNGPTLSPVSTFTTEAPNTAPVAQSQTLSTLENTGIQILLTAADADQDALAYRITAAPGHGTLSGTPPNVVYTPAAEYSGADAFEFAASDGEFESRAWVNLEVLPVDDAPVANTDTASTLTGASVVIAVLANDADPEGQALELTTLTQPEHGLATLNADSTITYRSAAGYTGPDTFTYTVSDGVNSAVGTVNVTVLANTLFSDGFESGNFTAGGWSVVGNASVDATARYAGNYGALLKKTASITRQLANVPVGNVEVVYWRQGSALSAAVPGVVEYSLDRQQTWILVETVTANTGWQQQRLALTGTGGNLWIRFSLSADGGKYSFMVDEVAVTAAIANSAPAGETDNYSLSEDGMLTTLAPGVLANDYDSEGDPLSAILLSGTTHGLLSFDGTGGFDYLPDANFNGTDSFTYKVSDGSLESAPVQVSITVVAVNDAPVATAGSFTGEQDTEIAVTLSGSDVDGDALSYSVATGPAKGTLSGSGASLTYTPAAGFSGIDSFTYVVNDGEFSSEAATVTLTVNKVNHAPVAVADVFGTSEDETLVIAAPGVLVNDTDSDNDALSAVLVSGAADGLVTLNADGSLTYTPDANFNGTDSFTYKVSDGSLESAPVQVSISVVAVNDAPVAAARSFTGQQDTAIAVTLSGSDVDGDALSYSVATGPANGTLSGTGASLTYTPAAGFVGTDSFTYEVNDGQASSLVATVTVTVQPKPSQQMHVASILVQSQDAGKGSKRGYAEVVIVDASGNPIAGAQVVGTFTEGIVQTLVVSTDAAGKAVFQTTTTVSGKAPKLTFTVNDVALSGWIYDSAANVETTDKNY